jgi:uncharacterized protein (DUF1778 family)
MRTSTLTKDARIEVRLAAWQKKVLVQAAELSGSNLTDYILMQALTAAQNTIKSNYEFALSVDQQIKIAEIISADSPPTATPELLALLEEAKSFDISKIKLKKIS